MSNNSIRVRTTPDNKDKFIKVKLDQDFDFIEVLSLKITQEEAYRNFCADYGVVVGRVYINNGFGVPNARVSVFIPIDDIDKDDPLLNGLYPYEVVSDKDIDGKRYNLLPKNSETNNECFTPVGTFPNKREVLDDPEMGYIYSKYYKFTTSTNYAGDYMIFGVPVGNHVIHIDADISDIGIVSQRPYDSISQGSPIQLFDSPTKFKGGTNLDKLIQIKSTNGAVNVQPFWGSVENCEIGISRIDLDLNYSITPSAIFMGGLFGDNDKNSVNKNCRPRRAMGKICEQNTSEGTIEMIRKTLDGRIEKIDIEGARLIDENGAWAYQIPMNLDYYVTNEFGELVLSEDPNKGIPTRANVRFKISMDNSGGEGRIRTKANYLIPHNPQIGNPDEIDYEFGELTKDSSFRDLYWNKIYSVSNFISRYQKSKSINPVTDRNFVGLKDVDDCVGDKNPVPFNRVNTVFNPLFFIICLIMKILEFVIYVINLFLITALNVIMEVINAILSVICWVLNKVRRILKKIGLGSSIPEFKFCDTQYWVPCIGSKCPVDSDESPKLFAPGCLNNRGKDELEKIQGVGSIASVKLGDLSDCIGFQLAKLLNLFQFDFYNDWLNGSLYYFLVKYKKIRKKEKFCNYDCSGNDCNSSILLDTCYSSEKDDKSQGIREGLIKKYKNELFYAPTNKLATNKLYATELINLGSVFNCDWQGIPKIQEFLTPTTYKLPPMLDIELDDSTTIDTSGQVNIGGVTDGLFFDISCLGLKVNQQQCLNVRHICEFGVDLDETDNSDNGTLVLADHIIGLNEINSQYGKYVRDVYFGLNNTINNVDISLPYSTDFNINNLGNYDFTTNANNGQDYVDFRGYLNNSSFSQPKHSYYFYFGVKPGSTGLEKMNNKFFTKCYPELTIEFFIKIDNVTPISEENINDGNVTFTIISGIGPFTYIVSGPNGFNVSGVLTEPNLTELVNGLGEGNYTITVTDSTDNIIVQEFEIPAPTPLYASANVSSNNNSLYAPFNGQITLLSVGGGSGTYTATLFDSNNNIVQIGSCDSTVFGASSNPTSITTTPLTFCGLEPNNYYIIVEDTSNPQQTVTINDLIINGGSVLNVSVTTTKPSCFDSKNGKIQIAVTGGIEPYIIKTNLQNSSQILYGATVNNIGSGQYNIIVTDSSNPEQVFTSQPIILQSIEPEMKLIAPSENELANQCDPNQYNIKFTIENGGLDDNNQNYTTKFNQAYYQINYNEQEDASGNLIWSNSQVISAPYNANNEFYVVIPSTTQFDSLAVRLTNPQGTCGSNSFNDETIFDKEQLSLPPNTLSINVNNIDNTKQCNVGFASFKFNISHFPAIYRTPYTMFYELSVNGGSFGSTIQYPTLITTNQQLITLQLPTVGGLPPNQVSIKVKIVDSVGCESQWFTIGQLNLPTQQIGPPIWTQVSQNNQCLRSYTLSGGIGPYTITSGFLPNIQYVVPCQNYATSIGGTDSIGCPFTFTYQQ